MPKSFQEESLRLSNHQMASALTVPVAVAAISRTASAAVWVAL